MGHLTRLSTRTTAATAGALLLAGGLSAPALASGAGSQDVAPPTAQTAADPCPDDSDERGSRSDDAADTVEGRVFRINADELAAADRYEVSDYVRVLAPLRSGRQAWVYVRA